MVGNGTSCLFCPNCHCCRSSVDAGAQAPTLLHPLFTVGRVPESRTGDSAPPCAVTCWECRVCWVGVLVFPGDCRPISPCRAADWSEGRGVHRAGTAACAVRTSQDLTTAAGVKSTWCSAVPDGYKQVQYVVHSFWYPRSIPVQLAVSHLDPEAERSCDCQGKWIHSSSFRDQTAVHCILACQAQDEDGCSIVCFDQGRFRCSFFFFFSF
jgi:hypothetical protein